MIERKVFKFKLEPTAEQERMLKAFAGARRFVYNWGLNRCREYYKETGQGISWQQLSQEFTALKNQPGLEWLQEMDAQALQQALADLKRAFVNFFRRRARYPRFKRRKDGRQSFRIPQRVKIEERRVYVPKIGWIKIRQSQPVDCPTKSATFKSDACGNWFVAVVAEFELQFFPSSKQCSECGHINGNLTLSDREWDCPHCGVHHQRDDNAAKNLQREGFRILVAAGHAETENACGASVRLPRRKQLASKQESRRF
jgi:transposase